MFGGLDSSFVENVLISDFKYLKNAFLSACLEHYHDLFYQKSRSIWLSQCRSEFHFIFPHKMRCITDIVLSITVYREVKFIFITPKKQI